MRIRNGLYVLNRARDEINEPPVEGGDEAVIIERENITRWRDVGAPSQAGIAAKLKGTALEPAQPVPGEGVTVQKRLGPRALIGGARSVPAQAAVYIFVIVPFLALVTSAPFAWGWGLSWLDIALHCGQHGDPRSRSALGG
jgi:hypothetical protein